MSWWHDDIDVWAGSDGTDLHKPYVDLINAAHERYLCIGRYYDENGNPNPSARLLNLVCNVNRSASEPLVYGTKAAPLDYEDVLGIPLNEFYHKCIVSAAAAIQDLVMRGGPQLFNHAWQAGWAKSPDWGGGREDWDGVWWEDTIEEEIGTMLDAADGFFVFGGPSNILHVAGLLKYYRRLIELLRWPLLGYSVTTGMTEEDDWIYGGIGGTCILPPPPDPPEDWRDVPIGTIRVFDKRGYLPQMGYNWRGAFTGTGPRDECPQTNKTVTPQDALDSAHFQGSWDERPRIDIFPHRHISKYVGAGGGRMVSVGPYEWRMIFIPPEFRGPPLYADRGWVVHSARYGVSVQGYYETKFKSVPNGTYGDGTFLKEFMYFTIQATTCPVVSWVVGDTTLNQPIPQNEQGYNSIGNMQDYYEVSGILNKTEPKVFGMRHAEALSENPFNGDYDEWHTYNGNDTVYILRVRTTVHGLGGKFIGIGGNGIAFALVDGGFEYV